MSANGNALLIHSEEKAARVGILQQMSQYLQCQNRNHLNNNWIL
ncbi:hypothetical protein XBFM1_60013 [Xenorhabdus bovienii str. feltiae Moldova]|uniref:Uncharacterized protein n=2 Tax=Xenorhabdus bovienii TaxID=40576 RepID=A0A077PY63_XENBV|nr:hypothetical protein XBFM1_60013 [Xenorhabdus bovienii str. feltiae Moldova]CDH26128.1 hypothetical protein XBKB1_440070 [Xenorhabdus bovienii str. kraussei Becker Underwood]